MLPMRTTLDIDETVMAELRALQRREGRSLGQVASELLARALADTEHHQGAASLAWRSQSMGARVDLDDRDAVAAALDAEP